MSLRRSISALSLAPDVRAWLEHSRHPRILHIFDRACNLINEHGRVLSIVIPEIGKGPFNLVLENDVYFSDYINIDSQVSHSTNQLNLGHLIIHMKDAKLWNPRPDWERLRVKRDDISDQLTNLPIPNYLKLGVFDCLHLNHRCLPITQSLISSLSTSLALADLPSSLAAAQRLAGLGIGLTPSGDDVIMGAIYAAWILHPPETAKVLAKEIAETAAPLTTSLSAAWLRSAGRGEAGVLWHEFFDALRSEDAVKIQKSVDRILAVGETSGSDALRGFVSTTIRWAENIPQSTFVNL